MMRVKVAIKKTGMPAMWRVVGTADNGEVSMTTPCRSYAEALTTVAAIFEEKVR